MAAGLADWAFTPRCDQVVAEQPQGGRPQPLCGIAM